MMMVLLLNKYFKFTNTPVSCHSSLFSFDFWDFNNKKIRLRNSK